MTALKVVELYLLLMLTVGCAVRRHPMPAGPSHKQMQKFEFRNCQMRDTRDGQNVCECKVVDWIRDIKRDNWIAICQQ